MAKKAQGLSLQTLVIAILALIVLVILVTIFTGKTAQVNKDITQCSGLLDFGESKGTCSPGPDCAAGQIKASAFGSECPKGQICCIVES